MGSIHHHHNHSQHQQAAMASYHVIDAVHDFARSNLIFMKYSNSSFSSFYSAGPKSSSSLTVVTSSALPFGSITHHVSLSHRHTHTHTTSFSSLISLSLSESVAFDRVWHPRRREIHPGSLRRGGSSTAGMIPVWGCPVLPQRLQWTPMPMTEPRRK